MRAARWVRADWLRQCAVARNASSPYRDTWLTIIQRTKHLCVRVYVRKSTRIQFIDQNNPLLKKDKWAHLQNGRIVPVGQQHEREAASAEVCEQLRALLWKPLVLRVDHQQRTVSGRVHTGDRLAEHLEEVVARPKSLKQLAEVGMRVIAVPACRSCTVLYLLDKWRFRIYMLIKAAKCKSQTSRVGRSALADCRSGNSREGNADCGTGPIGFSSY